MSKRSDSSLSLVPAAEIPRGLDVPVDDLVAVYRVCAKLESVCVAENGVGLSAVQVGIPWKLFVLSLNGRCDFFLNCEYEGLGEKITSLEGCLSLRSSAGEIRRFEVARYPRIRVRGKQLSLSTQGLELHEVDREVGGLRAVVMQHEIDHQHQVLISDLGKEIDLHS